MEIVHIELGKGGSYLADERGEIGVVEMFGDDGGGKELSVKDSKGSSMQVPANNLIGNRIRNYVPDGLDELRYRVSSHFFDEF